MTCRILALNWWELREYDIHTSDAPPSNIRTCQTIGLVSDLRPPKPASILQAIRPTSYWIIHHVLYRYKSYLAHVNTVVQFLHTTSLFQMFSSYSNYYTSVNILGKHNSNVRPCHDGRPGGEPSGLLFLSKVADYAGGLRWVAVLEGGEGSSEAGRIRDGRREGGGEGGSSRVSVGVGV